MEVMKWIVILTAVLVFQQCALADVIIHYKSDIKVAQSRQYNTSGSYNISGDKNYSESTTKFSMLNIPGTPFNIISKRIYRLDKGTCQTLLADSKFSESSIKSQHDSIEQIVDYSWTYNVTPIDGKKKINKYQCLGQIGKAVGINSANPADSVYITFEQWSSEDTITGAEFKQYQNRFSQVIGVHKMWAQDHLATFLESGYGRQFEKLSDLFIINSGIPIKIAVQIERTILPDDTNKGRWIKPNEGGNWKLCSIKYEVTALEVKKIDESKFEIPANYEKK
jgi:hypothetical protein